MRLLRGRRLDVALALAVAFLGQLDIWAPVTPASVHGPRPLVAAAFLATSLALAWRRRFPFAVAFFIVTVNVLQWTTLGASEGNGTFLPALISVYSVAAYAESTRALVAAPFVVAGLAVHEVTNPQNTDLADVVDALPWDGAIAAAWLLGAYMRRRRAYVAELEHRALEAEREREERARTAVTAERARIARELHDIVSHKVSVMVVQAEAAEEILRMEPQRVGEPLRKIQRSGREALGEMRRLLGILRSDGARPPLVPQPGMASLETLVEQVREAGLRVSLHIEGPPRPLPPGVDLSSYRVVQEALTNVLTHAGDASAEVTVRYGENDIALEVVDDGRSSPNGSEGGHGLVGMRERVQLYGGELEAAPRREGGFAVRARIPLG